MKTVKVASYKEVGFDYGVCEEIFENGTGLDVDGRFLEIGFWKEVFDSALEFEEDDNIIKLINEMISNISDIDDDVLVEF